MRSIPLYLCVIITILKLLFLCISSLHESDFQCKKNDVKAPGLPKAYSADIRINFAREDRTILMKYAIKPGVHGDKELIELRKSDRNVKYIKRGDEKSTLFIEFKENKHPKCELIKSTDIKDFLKKEDVGENNIILKVFEVISSQSQYAMYGSGTSTETGVFARQYEACISDPRINISMTFAAENWKMPYTTANNVYYPEVLIAEIGDVAIKAYYSSFNPSIPDDSLFMPSADIFCKDFQSTKSPPKMPDYFSYGAEMVYYDHTKNSIIPMVSQRQVYYDYKANISRTDFNDILATNSDDSKVTAQKKSIIHDYNSGVQYIIDSTSGKCTIDVFQETFSAISYEDTKDNRMFSGEEYFWLDDAETSYNGQLSYRGMMADVYTALRIDPKTRNPYIISWYFSTEMAQVAENENVEKNVLLSMYVHPQTEIKKENNTEIHFFNFIHEEPDILNFDLTRCYNDSSSKLLVFTFPAMDLLRGSEKLIATLTNFAIKDVTGVAKHRIYTKEVIFSGNYMYAEVTLLEESPIKKASSSKEVSLEEAVQKLKDSVSSGKFVVNVPTESETIALVPEPNGLNIFAGDRVRTPSTVGYHEGSVIGLTVGMLFLGFLLGAVTINLVLSRKFGVSLFQRSPYGKNNGFENSLYESSM